MHATETPIAAALRYASQGRTVLPLHAPHGAGCSCGRPDCASPAKHPRIQGGVHNATTDLHQVRTWWQRWPDANIGLATGHGHIVIDLDGPDAPNALANLQARHGMLPPTWTVMTGRGSHLHFAVDPTLHIANSASTLAPGVDIRGDGGYVLAPPSIHANGRRYTSGAERLLAALPKSWATLLTATATATTTTSLNAQTAQTTQSDATGPHPYALTVLHGEATRVATAAHGERNHNLNRAAFAIGTVLDAGGLDVDDVHSTLTAAATTAGLTAREASTTITSGLAAGRQRPRPIPHHPQTHPSRSPVTVDLERYGKTGWQWAVHHPGRTTNWRTDENGHGLWRGQAHRWQPVNTRRPYQLPEDRNAAWMAITRGFTVRTPRPRTATSQRKLDPQSRPNAPTPGQVSR